MRARRRMRTSRCRTSASSLGPHGRLVLTYRVGPGVSTRCGRPSRLPPDRATSHAAATRGSQLAPCDTRRPARPSASAEAQCSTRSTDRSTGEP